MSGKEKENKVNASVDIIAPLLAQYIHTYSRTHSHDIWFRITYIETDVAALLLLLAYVWLCVLLLRYSIQRYYYTFVYMWIITVNLTNNRFLLVMRSLRVFHSVFRCFLSSAASASVSAILSNFSFDFCCVEWIGFVTLPSERVSFASCFIVIEFMKCEIGKWNECVVCENG